MEPAYGYTAKLTHHLTVDGKTSKHVFAKRDQFAPELIEFSKCILEHRDPEASGSEGLIDVHIIRSLYRSAETGRPVPLSLPPKDVRPSLEQETQKPAVSKPEPIHAESPH